MIRQYGAQRHRLIETPRGIEAVGTIPVGTICRPGGWMPAVIVEAWIPRDYAAWEGAPRRMTTKRMRGGHIAQVRCLKDGRRFQISCVWLADTETSTLAVRSTRHFSTR